jgi:serine/threonine protein kinase
MDQAMTQTALGRYRIEKEIGRGAMGTVYRAYDPFLDQPIALKVSRWDESLPQRDQKLYESLFFNETHAASLLNHPGIVQVFDAGVEGESFYIAMEYVAGARTLEGFCRPENLLPMDKVADIIFRCAEALDYAHRKGVIHRDIKPGNILLSEGGDVKIADFSVALLVDPRIVDTQVMVPVGSPMYMSPEQIREDTLTSQSDLFSLGVVLYELLTGKHPFHANTLASVTYGIVNHPHPPLEPQGTAGLDGFSHIIDKVLAKEPGQRYQSALDFAADLSQTFSQLKHPQDGIATEGRADLLKSLSFFQAFPDAEIWELLRWADWEEYRDGEKIISEGEEEDSFFIVVNGAVKVCKGVRPIARLEAGECFGEIGYLGHQKRSASIIADGDISVLRMNAELIERASQSCQVAFHKVFIRTLIDRLVQTTTDLAGQS